MDLPAGSLLIYLAAQVVMLGYLGYRKWPQRAARLTLVTIVPLIVLNLGMAVRLMAGDAGVARLGGSLEILSLAAFGLGLLLLTSQLLAPRWWRGRRVVRWMVLPYLAACGLLALDLLGQFGWLVQGVNQGKSFYYLDFNSWYGLALMFSGWVVIGVVLAWAAWQQRGNRFLAGMLAGPVGLPVLLALADRFQISAAGPAMTYLFMQELPLWLLVLYLTRTGQFDERLRLDLALDALNEVVAVVDKHGEVSYSNTKAGQLGLRNGQSLLQALEKAGVSNEELAKKNLRYAEEPAVFVAPDQKVEIKVTPLVDEQAQAQGCLIVSHDITELERRNSLLEQERIQLAEAVSRLDYLSRHDKLTDLFNRDSLVEKLELEVARVRSQGKFPGWEALRSPYTPENNKSVLLFLDLDNFKLVNDTLGHGAGDQLLIDLARLIQEQLRPRDVLARFGGDEFAIMLNAVSLEQAQQLAWRICAAVESFRFRVQGRSFELGVSIGLVEIESQANAQAVLTQADIAMYAAKEQGRNRVVIYNQQDSSLSQLSDANQWTSEIKDALKENRLLLHYQPIVRLEDRIVSHYEALMRMQDRQGQLIGPAMFITAIEQYGMMNQVNRWLIQQGISMLLEYPKANLFLNLSIRSLVDENLLQFIEEQIQQNKIGAGRLGFEITENLAIADIEQAERSIQRLKKLGCSFALDDFGAGFNSFALMGSLSVDKIKIDGLLIRRLDENLTDQAVVRAIHNMAAAMGKETVAEFVQNEATAKILQSIGITYGQGYQLGKPEPVPAFHTPGKVVAFPSPPPNNTSKFSAATF